MQQKLSANLLNAHLIFGPSLRKVACAIASVQLDGSHLWRKDPDAQRWVLSEKSLQVVVICCPRQKGCASAVSFATTVLKTSNPKP